MLQQTWKSLDILDSQLTSQLFTSRTTISHSEGWIILNWVWSQHKNLSLCTKFSSKMSICCSTHQYTVVIPAGKKATYRHLAALQLQFCHLALPETHFSADWKVDAQNGVAAFWPGTSWPSHTLSPLHHTQFIPVHHWWLCTPMSPIFLCLLHANSLNTQNLVFLSLIWYIQSV